MTKVRQILVKSFASTGNSCRSNGLILPGARSLARSWKCTTVPCCHYPLMNLHYWAVANHYLHDHALSCVTSIAGLVLEISLISTNNSNWHLDQDAEKNPILAIANFLGFS